MSRWLVVLGVGVLVLLAVLWWKMSGDPAEVRVEAASSSPSSAGPEVRPPTDASAEKAPVWVDPSRESTAGANDSSEKVELIDPKSETFNHRIDVAIGNQLRARAAFDCDESGMDPNAALKLGYRLRIVNGRVTVSDVRVLESEVTPEYERCFVERVEAASFRMEDMPDFEEGDQELFTRVRSMKKYRTRAAEPE